MRNRWLFIIVLLLALATLGGCGSTLKGLKEGWIPPVSSKNGALVHAGVAADVRSGVIDEITKKRKIHLSGLEPGRTILYLNTDNSWEEREVLPDGTFSFFAWKDSMVPIQYVFGDYGRTILIRLDSRFDHRWVATEKTFESVQPDEKKDTR